VASAALEAAALFVATMSAHEGHGDGTLNQSMPPFLMRWMSRYEHVILRPINWLARTDWAYRYGPTKRFVDWTSRRVMNTINGEVLTLDEVRSMLDSLFASGETVAVGTCPCRRARNEISDTVPNNTDMVFGKWAEEYVRNYPGLYHRLDPDEARELVEEFDRCGFLHQVYGYHQREGAAYVLCNCDKDICIPLQAQKERGFQAFRKGRSVAVVDTGRCLGIAECGLCLQRCPFDARVVGDGKSLVEVEQCFGCGVCICTCRGEASALERKKGAQLVYTRNLVD
jgi:ferredoxin